MINVSVQYNGGLLPDIILLTRCGHIGEPIWYHEEVLSLQPMFPPKPLDNFPPEGGCSEGLDAFRFFLNTAKNTQIQTATDAADEIDAHEAYFSVQI